MNENNVHDKGVYRHQINMSKITPDRDSYLMDIVSGKKVVHIGCADSPFTEEKLISGDLLHEKIYGKASRIIGVDVDVHSINYLRSKRPNWELVCADIQTDSLKDVLEGFDIVLFPEVIEHLSNPGLFLDGLKKSMDRESLLVITTPNAFSWRSSLRAFYGVEVLHQDHVLSFTPSTIKQLLFRHGFSVCDMVGYGKGWSPNVLKRLLSQPIRMLHRFNNATIDGLIVFAKKIDT